MQKSCYTKSIRKAISNDVAFCKSKADISILYIPTSFIVLLQLPNFNISRHKLPLINCKTEIALISFLSKKRNLEKVC